jgi:HD-like signal output (HDOD) protein
MSNPTVPPSLVHEDADTEAFAKQRVRERVLNVAEKDSAVPAFSVSAQKLLEVSSKDEADIGEISQVVQLDPGLTSKYLRLANSSYYGGKSIMNVEEALLRIGLGEVRKLAAAVVAMSGTSCFRNVELVKPISMHAKIDWNMFWLHSLFTARLTDILANAYRRTSGKEYLAGLLHDAGKLFMERHFTHEFEAATLRAIERGQGLYASEKQLFDITHAEASWALAEKWKLHREICRAIRFHHEPQSPFNKDPVDPEWEQFLATCLCLADTLANICGANILGARKFEGVEFESLPEWHLMQRFNPRGSLDLNPVEELEKTKELISALGADFQSEPAPE